MAPQRRGNDSLNHAALWGVQLIGDLPSTWPMTVPNVWANRQLFFAAF